MEKTHLEQARPWLEAADFVAGLSSPSTYAVASSMLIHSIIKANDALTWRFLHQTARRHDDARRLFEEMVRRGRIGHENASLGETLQTALSQKSAVEYRARSVSKRDFTDLRRLAVRFHQMAESLLCRPA